MGPRRIDLLYHKLKSMLGHLGMHPDHLFPRHAYLKTDIPVAGVAHQAGTCRFGTDPATSVVNTDCRAHEVDNLYVVDTSIFPSIGAVRTRRSRRWRTRSAWATTCWSAWGLRFRSPSARTGP